MTAKMKKFSLYIPKTVAEVVEACAVANGMKASTLLRLIIERGVDKPINISAPRKAAR